MKKKYIVITPFFPDATSFRGPYILDQVNAIKECDLFDVIVLKPVSVWSKEDKKDYEYEGIKVFRFKTYELPSAILPGYFDSFSINSLIQKLHSLNINIDNIAVVHTHVCKQAIYANYLKGINPKIKTILQHHGFDVLGLETGKLSKYNWHRKWTQKYGIELCDKIDLHIGVSQKTLDYLCAYSELNIKDQYVLFNGVDYRKFYKENTIQNKVFTVGCVANFWPLKDQITLLRALNELLKDGKNQFLCRFIGTGECLVECMRFAEEHNLLSHVSFEREVSHVELRRFYNSLDLFVLPSYHEAFGCVYTEAIACGVAFVGVKEQGVSEILPIEIKNDWLIDKGDYMRLKEIIIRQMKYNHSQYLSLSIDIKELIKNFLGYIREL